jgi:serine phosphatase RsbU (regulator of sigma subunit)
MDRVLLLLANTENRRLLSEWLSSRYEVTAPDVTSRERSSALAEAFDLCVLDGPALQGLGPWIRAVKSAHHPAFLPFLFVVAHKHDIGRASAQLWRTVDELVAGPVEKIELNARVEMLLRARRLSLENAVLLRQVEADLARARDVQQQLLPQQAIAMEGFQLAARCIPSREVGGDFYDWQEVAPGSVVLTLGDVMGKGMAAALWMATLRATLRVVTRPDQGPAAALRVVSRVLEADLERAGSFVTLFHSRLDVRARRLLYVDAGHGHGILRRADGKITPIERCGCPVGVAAGLYDERSLQFDPGDTLAIYSDGLIDVRLRGAPPSPRELADQLGDALEASAMVGRLVSLRMDQSAPADDLTVLVLHCTGAPGLPARG